MNELTFNDLKMLSENNRRLSTVISPVTTTAISSLLVLPAIGTSFLYVIFPIAVMIATDFAHDLYGLRRYTSRWRYLYKVTIKGDVYHIAKDGAGRIRVIYEQSHSLKDLRNDEEFFEETMSQWLKTDTPELGTLTEKTGKPHIEDLMNAKRTAISIA